MSQLKNFQLFKVKTNALSQTTKAAALSEAFKIGILLSCLNLLMAPQTNTKLKLMSLKIIKTFLKWPRIELLFMSSFVLCLGILLKTENEAVLKELLTIIDEIVLENNEHFINFIREDIFELFPTFFKSTDTEVARLSVYVITDLFENSSGADIFQVLDKCPILRSYSDLLKKEDFEIQITVLKGLREFLRLSKTKDDLNYRVTLLRESQTVLTLNDVANHNDLCISSKAKVLLDICSCKTTWE